MPLRVGERAVLELSAAVSDLISSDAARAFPEECCGALLADAKGVITARALENAAPDRGHAFLISAKDYLRLEAEADAQGLTLAGFYHSHPDAPATPSATDAEAAWPELWTVIVPVIAGVPAEPRAFRFDATTRKFNEGAIT